MPRAPQRLEPSRIITPNRGTFGNVRPPLRDDRGRELGQRPLANERGRLIAPRPEHFGRFNDEWVRGRVNEHYRNWDRNDHGYYWEGEGDRRFCHHYDEFGFHWYGWYIGEVYFWTRYYEDRYWWYDRYWNRWCYLNENRWWYQEPTTSVVYLYTDDGYYQYNDSASEVVMIPDNTPPVENPPAVDENGSTPEVATFYSLDGTRAVRIVGANEDAYLYDTDEQPAFEPFALASNVKRVDFSTEEDKIKIALFTQKLQLIGGEWKQVDKTKYFDGDGNKWGAAPPPLPAAPTGASIDKGIGASSSFQTLSLGNINW
jgi:hypothetical protein